MTIPKLDAIADTSFVLGMALATESKHEDCLRVYRQFRNIGLLEAAYAEIAFMLTREGGVRATAQFLSHLQKSKYRPVTLEDDDYPRISALLTKYSASEIDFVDIAIVACAEHLNITRILTLDRRDFDILRPAHVDHFEILP